MNIDISDDLAVDYISRQAVLDTLESMDKVLGKDSVDRTVETYKELLMECYKVLPSKVPQATTTQNDPSDDCISRTRAIKELKESAEHHANNSREESLLLRDRDIIRALPSITPKETRTGKWQYFSLGFKKCPHCGALWDYQIYRNTFCNYCPTCGNRVENEAPRGKEAVEETE